jgi:hypothetical protein
MGGPLFAPGTWMRRVEDEIVKGRAHERNSPEIPLYIKVKSYAMKGLAMLGVRLWAKTQIALNLKDVPKKAATSDELKDLKQHLTDVIQRSLEDSGRKPIKSEMIAETSVRPEYYDPFIRMPNTTNR